MLRNDDRLDPTPDQSDMVGGYRGLCERIERDVPVRVRLGARPPLPDAGDDFAEAARRLHGVEHGLDSLWPQD